MNKRARASTPPRVNVRSTTTPDSHSITTSDTWLSQHLIVDYTLGTLQVLVHYVTTNRYAEWMNCENFLHELFLTWQFPNLRYVFIKMSCLNFGLYPVSTTCSQSEDRHWQKLAATFKKLKQIYFCSPCLFMWDDHYGEWACGERFKWLLSEASRSVTRMTWSQT